jgi:hypothetical protein
MKLIAAFKAFFAILFAKAIAKGTAAVKLAETDTKLLLAKARVAAIDLENKAKAEVASFLETEANRVHAEHDLIREKIEGVISKL